MSGFYQHDLHPMAIAIQIGAKNDPLLVGVVCQWATSLSVGGL